MTPVTPRIFRLLRVTGLRGAQRAVALAGCGAGSLEARTTAVLVPTRDAAMQLRQTLDRLILLEGWQPDPSASLRAGLEWRLVSGALAAPDLLTREQLYAALATVWPFAARVASTFEREVLLRAAAEAARVEGHPPPFEIRPGLVGLLLGFYDALRRRRRSVDDFERVLVGELEASAESDRGAERLLRQAHFMSATFRGYDRRLASAGAIDEHGLREAWLSGSVAAPYQHLVITLADQAGDPRGLWPADFDLFTRLPGVKRIDVVATESMLGTGWNERLHELLPGIEECRLDLDDERPVIVAPDGPSGFVFVSRDREEELTDAVRRVLDSSDLAGGDATGPLVLNATAFVYQRPLPYLYLARQVLEAAGLPYEASDALPLAAEPYAASLDLVASVVTSKFTRSALVAMLSSPHFRFELEGRTLDRRDIVRLAQELEELEFLGGRERLGALADALAERARASRSARTAAILLRAASDAANELADLEREAPPSRHLERLLSFLEAHDRPLAADDPLVERHQRVRTSILGALRDLGEAEAAHADRPTTFSAYFPFVQRWIEDQTFTPRTGSGGLRLVDASAAAYGEFSTVHLLGLVEAEWPPAAPRTVLFPPGLLRDLGWPRDADRLVAARATFQDLLGLARRQVSASAFTLEDDAIVRPSVFVEDLGDAGLAITRRKQPPPVRRLTYEAMTVEPIDPEALAGPARAWLDARMTRSPRDDPRYHGSTGVVSLAPYAVTSVETYLSCPFKYFASKALRLEEERPDEPLLSPLERGRFVHEVLQRFYEAWDATGELAITRANLGRARALFTNVALACLESLPPANRPIERLRLLGSGAAVGVGERVLLTEAAAPAPIVERLLEHDLSGAYTFESAEGPRKVSLKGKADRIDLVADGTLRLIDYKSGRPPALARSVQLPIYAAAAEHRLDGHRGRQWQVAAAGYVALAGVKVYEPVIESADTRREVLAEGQARFLEAVDGIEAGRFPPRPAELRLCTRCGFAGVCRKDYVDA